MRESFHPPPLLLLLYEIHTGQRATNPASRIDNAAAGPAADIICAPILFRSVPSWRSFDDCEKDFQNGNDVIILLFIIV
jgi:hypothetical protein